MGSSTKRPLLFIHSNGPTHTYLRDEVVKSEIRRHIMVDIGRARRKPLRNPQVDVLMQPSTDVEMQHRKSRRLTKAHARDEEPLAASLAGDQPLVSLKFPFWDQHPLVVLEKQWEMDMFSAYGIALVVSEGKNQMAKNDLARGFWFPFAFRASNFLHHFQQTLTSPDMLAAVSSVRENTFQMMALQRSLGTISCIQATLADPDLSRATANNVIRAVLASICYNVRAAEVIIDGEICLSGAVSLTIHQFVSSEFSQALIHIKGLGRLISANGGMESLQNDKDLRLMIFWVDITAALLFTLRPQFPLPWDLIPELALPECSGILPMPLLKLTKETESSEDGYASHVIFCLRDLWAVAAFIKSEVTVNGNRLWKDEESMGLRLNPIAHRLLSLSRKSESTSQSDSIVNAIQLGEILWIIWIKRRYRSYPGSPAVYASKLLSLISDQRVWAVEANLLSVRLWLLVLCGISSSGTEERRAVNMIADVMQRWRLKLWSEVMIYVCQMPWVGVFDTLCAGLESKLCQC